MAAARPVRRRRVRSAPAGLILLAGVLPLAGQAPAPSPAPVVDVAPILEAALADADRRGIPRETIALRVDLPGGARIGHRNDVPQAPASTLKLLTAVAALDLLGPDHILATELWAEGEIRDGTLHGDLIVVGSGDPATSSRRFPDDPVAELRPWIAALRERGIRRVAGDLVGDDRALAGPSRLEEWPEDQLHRWYCAPSGALNINDNCVDVVIAPRAAGGIGIALRPENSLFSVENALRATSDRKRHVYAVDRAVGSWQIRVSGRFLANGAERTEWITAPDPTEFFLGTLRSLLAEGGIEIGGAIRRGARSPSAVRVARIEHRISELLPVLLKNSQNLYGDCLLRIVDRAQGGDGSFASAGRRVAEYVSARLGGGTVAIRDGSGLSRENRITCDDLVRVLARADASPWGALLRDALPIAAVDGTLDRRFRGTPLAGRLRGKTGHLSGVTGLAGGWESAAGRVRFAALTGGAGTKVGPFRDWLDATLVRIDAALGGAPRPSPSAGGGSL